MQTALVQVNTDRNPHNKQSCMHTYVLDIVTVLNSKNKAQSQILKSAKHRMENYKHTEPPRWTSTGSKSSTWMSGEMWELRLVPTGCQYTVSAECQRECLALDDDVRMPLDFEKLDTCVGACSSSWRMPMTQILTFDICAKTWHDIFSGMWHFNKWQMLTHGHNMYCMLMSNDSTDMQIGLCNIMQQNGCKYKSACCCTLQALVAYWLVLWLTNSAPKLQSPAGLPEFSPISAHRVQSHQCFQSPVLSIALR